MNTVDTICEFLKGLAPLALAESWDNVGLILGDRGEAVSRVMTCLTVTPKTAGEAIDRGANLIVTHHPVLFRPTQKLTTDDIQGGMLWRLIRASVAVYSPHTAYDGAAGGINEMIATRLKLANVAPLRPAAIGSRVKLVVFVPNQDLERVSNAVFQAGAGVIGEYRECSFRLAGRGTFFGSENANPTIGRAGRREEVDEWRLEVVCPKTSVQTVVTAMRLAHSYEEPAFDIYPLDPVPGSIGAGRAGELESPLTATRFAELVRDAVGATLVQVVGAANRQIRRAAIACGSGAEFLGDAIAARCDALVTGEASFHRQLEAESSGIVLVTAGHYATERFAVEELAIRIGQQFQELEVWPSATEQDPSWIAARL